MASRPRLVDEVVVLVLVVVGLDLTVRDGGHILGHRFVHFLKQHRFPVALLELVHGEALLGQRFVERSLVATEVGVADRVDLLLQFLIADRDVELFGLLARELVGDHVFENILLKLLVLVRLGLLIGSLAGVLSLEILDPRPEFVLRDHFVADLGDGALGQVSTAAHYQPHESGQ